MNECTLFYGQETFKINFIMFVIKTDKQTKTHERPFMESMRLKNKTAVITGASRGIGKAIALQFASEGCNIVINFRSNEQAAQDVKAQVKAKGVTGLVIQADVTDRKAVKKKCLKMPGINWAKLTFLSITPVLTSEAGSMS